MEGIMSWMLLLLVAIFSTSHGLPVEEQSSMVEDLRQNVSKLWEEITVLKGELRAHIHDTNPQFDPYENESENHTENHHHHHEDYSHHEGNSSYHGDDHHHHHEDEHHHNGDRRNAGRSNEIDNYHSPHSDDHHHEHYHHHEDHDHSHDSNTDHSDHDHHHHDHEENSENDHHHHDHEEHHDHDHSGDDHDHHHDHGDHSGDDHSHHHDHDDHSGDDHGHNHAHDDHSGDHSDHDAHNHDNVKDSAKSNSKTEDKSSYHDHHHHHHSHRRYRHHVHTQQPPMDNETRVAFCDLKPNAEYSESNVSGLITIKQRNDFTGPLYFELELNGFNGTEDGSDSAHGFHVHEYNITDNKCSTAGGHFNPTSQKHGPPYTSVRHVGDLGNLVTNGEGKLKNVTFTDRIVKFSGQNNIIGRSIVVHKLQDDFGQGGNQGSLTVGNAGPKLACCTIMQRNSLATTLIRFNG